MHLVWFLFVALSCPLAHLHSPFSTAKRGRGPRVAHGCQKLGGSAHAPRAHENTRRRRANDKTRTSILCPVRPARHSFARCDLSPASRPYPVVRHRESVAPRSAVRTDSLLGAHLFATRRIETGAGHRTKLAIRTDPQSRMNLLWREDLAYEDVAREQVVVHRLLHNARDRRVAELDESVVLRCSCLHSPSDAATRTYTSAPTFLFRDSRRRLTSPNCEKYSRISSS